MKKVTPTLILAALGLALALLIATPFVASNVTAPPAVAKASSSHRLDEDRANNQTNEAGLVRETTAVKQHTPAAVETPQTPNVAAILAEVGDLSRPGARDEAVRRIRELERTRREAALAEAGRRNLPVRIERPDGTVQELVAFESGRPVYFTTHNIQAAISTGADVLKGAPYSLSGSGMVIGIWDGGSGRASHQEFSTGSRLVVRDGSASIDHATHVSGTLAAAGADARAKGMAPSATIDSYDWNSDLSEMTSRAAAAPAEAGKLYLSNHSYGYISGWNYTANTGNPARLWEWYGDGTSTTGYDQDFGRYNTYSANSDALAFSAPYYLIFRSAGNERNNNPVQGSTVALAPGSTTVVAYNSSVHPAGDGTYRGGHETISFDALAKNVITVGAVNDAVSSTGTTRSTSAATMTTFSSWGPTDDGRIKPDIVANGFELYSSLNTSNSTYGIYSGTSMSTPNATGTAALLIQEYGRLFPGGAMRSSTLKGLLIHTADDLGDTGPDYRNGWGLIDGVAAVDLLRDHAASPLKRRITEASVTTSAPTSDISFVWDGVSPIRATLIWTDPAGASTTTNDLRTPRLVNNLDLKIIGPDGSEHFPFVMPFVGTWTQASMSLPATRGLNSTDNVEQVLITAPPVAGVYRCIVSYRGTLTNSSQTYSLLVDGGANATPPPPPLSIRSITPTSALAGAVTIDVSGVSFAPGATVALVRSGYANQTATSTTFNSSTALRAQFNLSGAAAGIWSVRVTNPNAAVAELAGAFTIIGAIWSESFDGTVSGWTSQASIGTNAWTLVSTVSHSPNTSWFAPGPDTKSTTSLTSAAINIPANATNLQLSFWHRYDLEDGRDSGKLELSVNGGTWFDAGSANSGTVFASNGYNRSLPATGKPADRNEFAGQTAWSGSSGGFIRTLLNLTDTAKFAGKTLRLRWRLATNAGTPSAGWHVDTLSLLGGGDLSNQAPTITTPPDSASTELQTDLDGKSYEVVRGQEIQLSVRATDDGGEPGIVYSWSSTQTGPAPYFTVNDSNGAKDSVVQFEAAGDYLVSVSVRDAQGLSTSASMTLRVLPVATSLTLSPPSPSLPFGDSVQFAATQLDQFGHAVSPQPTSFTWSASGGGSISGSGRFTANAAGGPYTITASDGTRSGFASVTVNRAQASITIGNLTQTFNNTAKRVSVETQPAGLPYTVTYNGSAEEPIAVGSYVVEVVITDANYQGAANASLSIEPGANFESWAAAKGLSSEDLLSTADPDADGLANALEYALGLEPKQASVLPEAMIVADTLGSPRLTLTFTRPTGISDVVWRFRFSSNLIDWQDATDVAVATGETPGTESLTVRDPQVMGTTPRFMRIEVQLQP